MPKWLDQTVECTAYARKFKFSAVPDAVSDYTHLGYCVCHELWKVFMRISSILGFLF